MLAGLMVKMLKFQKVFLNFYVPLKSLLGFAEDYTKILLNCKHELILIRTKSDANLISSEKKLNLLYRILTGEFLIYDYLIMLS